MDDLDLIERLRRTRLHVEPPGPAYERLLARRHRKRLTARIASIAVAFAVAATGVVSALSIANARHASPGEGGTAPFVGGPGQYYYWKMVLVLPNGHPTIETWWRTDDSGARRSCCSTEGYSLGPDATWGPGAFPKDQDLSGFSTDPSTLRGQLLDSSAPGGASPEPQVTVAPGVSVESSDLWRAGTAILQMPNATPELRIAVYEVLASLPEAQLETGVQDPVGRNADTVKLTLGDYYGGGTDVVYVDPQTHLFLAYHDSQSDEIVVVTAGGIVDSVLQTPTSDQVFLTGPQDVISGSSSGSAMGSTAPAVTPSPSPSPSP